MKRTALAVTLTFQQMEIILVFFVLFSVVLHLSVFHTKPGKLLKYFVRFVLTPLFTGAREASEVNLSGRNII